MGLLTCPDCGSQISSNAVVCPRCGRQLQPLNKFQNSPYQQGYYGRGPEPPSKNNNTAIIALAIIAAALAIGAGILWGMRECDNRNDNTTPTPTPTDTIKVIDTVKVVDTTYVKIKEVEKIKVPERPPEPPEYIPDELNGYYITSGGGYGAYLRKRPTTDSKKITTYREGTYFEGAYSSRDPRWIMVVEDGRIVGYIHEENVTPSEFY